MNDALLTFFDSYKTVLGGLSIAIATVIAVYLNYIVSKKTSRQARDARVASIAAALACELMDNTDNLIELYNEIEGKNTKQRKILQYQDFEMRAYETLLSQIGEMGAPLSFMLVDVYGDLRKLSRSLEILNAKELANEEGDFLVSIKEILAKGLTTSIVVVLYSDYLNGVRFSQEIRSKREVWIEQTFHNFCSYASETEEDLEFVDAEEKPKRDFVKRFARKEDREQIRGVLSAIDRSIVLAQKNPSWKAPLIFRALSYEIQTVLTNFLGLEHDIYEQALQEEYSLYLKR